ncbi:RagB/SusD family nutrient uptake outer membrane protein [Hymenobacter psoromatis]|uniref:RagB/SusD family nutrient uptake outer membrane protein n=1 Tax=Hymenobacter psoromatis TaxID=1484116 RepID=UPI001CBDBF34|nr:RagB/SusD family nutrient uptake outer membrane protein [Hymenobacter psoromatis]
MKTRYKLLLPLLLLSATACKKEFLDEQPLDFLSTTNSYNTLANFQAATNNLYSLVRIEFYTRNETAPMDYLYGTDIVFDGSPSVDRFTNYAATLDPSATLANTHWQGLYKIVAEANTIISRLPTSAVGDADQKVVEGRARFFRAFAYRTLTYMYGDVPLVTAEVTSAAYNYTRAPQADVYKQAIADLTIAAANLPGPTAVRDGEISNAAAQHLLAEVALAAGQYQQAVTAATAVIGDPNMKLMRARFGSTAGVMPGDVYYDLFRRNNQNRSAGNTEGIWVVQFETDLPGGSATSTGFLGSALYERHFGVGLGSFVTGGVSPFRWPTGDLHGGRGVALGLSTKYFSNTIWASDFTTDMRNANHNFVRVFTYNNPATPAYYGKTVSTESPPADVVVPSRPFSAYQSKVTTPGQHPAALYIDPATLYLKSSAGGTYADQYMFRLPETYLIRAEAYLKLNNLTAAAADLNFVRARANASPVAPGSVNIDYILDERMRELGVEEKRRLTLMRLGLLYDRVKKCNPYYADIQPRFNLLPIPSSEIERNREVKLPQNPGY